MEKEIAIAGCVVCYSNDSQGYNNIEINWAEEIVEILESENQKYYANIVFHGMLTYSGNEEIHLKCLHPGKIKDVKDLSNTWVLWDGDFQKAGNRKKNDPLYANRYNFCFLKGGERYKHRGTNREIAIVRDKNAVAVGRGGDNKYIKAGCENFKLCELQKSDVKNAPMSQIVFGPIIASTTPRMFRISFRFDEPVLPQGKSPFRRATIFDPTQVIDEISDRYNQLKAQKDPGVEKNAFMYTTWLFESWRYISNIGSFSAQVLVPADKTSLPCYGNMHMAREPYYFADFDPPCWSYAFSGAEGGKSPFRSALTIIEP